MMTQLERFRAFLARQKLDRPLRYAGYTPSLEERLRERLDGRDPADYFRPDTGRGVRLREPEDYLKPDFTRYYDEAVDPAEIDRLGVLRKKGDFYHFTHTISPLRNAQSLQDIESFPIETEQDWCEEGMTAQVEAYHREGYFVSGAVGHIYEDSWQIRGYEQFLVDLLERREWAESILDRIADRNVRRAVAAARAGADVIHTGDDIANQKAMMFEPDLWREVLKKRWARVYAAARQVKADIAIWYHSDGNIMEVIPDLIEIGVTILNPLQPECMDVGRIYRLYGDRLLFDGSIGTQSVFPWGTPDDVQATVKARREVFGDTLILAPTHVLEPEVPLDNIFAFYEACDGVSY